MIVCMHGYAASEGDFGDGTQQNALRNEQVTRHGTMAYDKWTWTNAPVTAVFLELATVGGVDIVASDKIVGKVSLTVTNKSWRQVLDIICKLKELVIVPQGAYLYIETRAEFESEKIVNQAIEENSPLRREIIQLSNIPAEEALKTIEPLISTRGKITSVKHNNAVVVLETERTLASIREMIHKLDVETEQIAIAAKIVEVSSGDLQNLGIQWGLFNSINGVDIAAKHLSDAGDNAPMAISGQNIVSNVLDKLTYGIVSPSKFSIALNYLFENSKADVIAQPSITTVDNKEARIFMGGQIPLMYQDVAGNTLVKYMNAGTELIVIPHVTDGKRITLDIKAKKESANADKSIATQDASTNVVVNDGETVVIAGLTSNETQEIESGIPFLKDIPLIGFLFKRKETRVAKKDLIIFVTPHIIQKDLDGIPAVDMTTSTGVPTSSISQIDTTTK